MKCFRIGCYNEPTREAIIIDTSHTRRTIHLCIPCYRTLESNRIIRNGMVVDG